MKGPSDYPDRRMQYKKKSGIPFIPAFMKILLPVAAEHIHAMIALGGSDPGTAPGIEAR